jgi:hypothetical protein
MLLVLCKVFLRPECCPTRLRVRLFLAHFWSVCPVPPSLSLASQFTGSSHTNTDKFRWNGPTIAMCAMRTFGTSLRQTISTAIRSCFLVVRCRVMFVVELLSLPEIPSKIGNFAATRRYSAQGRRCRLYPPRHRSHSICRRPLPYSRTPMLLESKRRVPASLRF